MPFRFVDLFAGVGGFHAVGYALGGEGVYAVEVDEAAARIYRQNWGLNPLGDITTDANDHSMRVPEHDVLFAGFPCQPFSKSGAQQGMDETRGTLYWNILRIIQARRPAFVFMENVRNLAGPRHRHEWDVIVSTLREEGYRVSQTPTVFSPHLLPPERGGRPQVRERVFIAAVRVEEDALKTAEPVVMNRPVDGWDPHDWDLETHLPLDPDAIAKGCDLSESERLWIDAWDDFVIGMWKLRQGERLPGFPLWADAWHISHEPIPEGTPKWKADFLAKNAAFYAAHSDFIDEWAQRWGVYTDAFPPSKRKLEWQAQDTPRLWDTVMHLRPSGIRAKRPTYLPALVAMTQTSIIGSRQRRLSPREAARLQGLPDSFSFHGQTASRTYKQLGNGVSIGAVWHVLREHVLANCEVLAVTAPGLLKAVLDAPLRPDDVLANHAPQFVDLSAHGFVSTGTSPTP
jgi:DNA (cytosine-5)-methyltransferase 1